MIGLLHGYFLEGSGSNLWTRSMAQALCREGRDIHLVCQENHPERYDFVARALRYHADGTIETFYERDTPYPGKAFVHKPQIGTMLPVYVGDRYEEFTRVVRMPDLTDEEIETYVETNARVVAEVVERHNLKVLHANHTVLMPTVAQRVRDRTGVPFVVMPHGSAIEYAVKRDTRLRDLAAEALAAAEKIFVVGPELHQRMRDVFAEVEGLDDKLSCLRLGADTSAFEPIAPPERPSAIKRLCESLRLLPRGRTPEQTSDLLHALAQRPTAGFLRATLATSSQYDGSRADLDLEAKLGSLDWTRDPVLLFVGRLIAAKGPQSLIAALPAILEARPDLRVVIVGHGPLREALELLIVALARNNREWVDLLIREGTMAEPDPRPLTEVRALLDTLGATGQLARYFTHARGLADPGRVIFTGYLTHAELRHLFGCCDVAVFPSVVREAGPLVFLEALAAGCFPLGTYFGGMGASIDAVAEALPSAHAAIMKLSPDPLETARDIAKAVPLALGVVDEHRAALRKIAVERYDWRSVARAWAMELGRIGGL